MFTFADQPLKVVGLLVLFLFTTAWSTRELVQPQDRVQRVSNALHLVMSVVMVAMVLPLTWHPVRQVLPPWLLTGVFVASVAWFVALAVSRPGLRLHYAGHATMFAAMAWHLAGMQVRMATMAGMAPMAGSPMTGAPMGGHTMHDHTAPSHAAMAGGAGDAMRIVALVGVPLMAYLLVAGVRDLVRALRPAPAPAQVPAPAPVLVGAAGSAEPAACHAPRPVASPGYRLAALAGFAMNIGMFWMSTGLLAPLMG